MHGDEIIIEGIRCGGGCNPFLNLLENLFLLQVKACTNNRFKAFRWILNGIDNSKLNCAVLDNVRVALISTIGIIGFYIFVPRLIEIHFIVHYNGLE